LPDGIFPAAGLSPKSLKIRIAVVLFENLSARKQPMMKHLVGALAGMVVGAAITLVVVFVFKVGLPQVKEDIIWFEKVGDCMTKENLKVFQIIAPNKALVGEEKDELLDKPIMLLVTHHKIHLYDEQVLPMPTGRCAKHAGNFSLETKDDGVKIIPVVVVE